MDASTLDDYVAALLAGDIPGPKEITAIVETEWSEELADALDRALEDGRAGLSVMPFDDRPCTFAKVRANPWELHDVLRDLAAMSRRFPALRISVQLEPDGDEGSLVGGVYTGIPDDAITRWVAKYPRLDALASPFMRCRCTPKPFAAVRDAIDRLDHPGLDVTLEGGTIDIRLVDPAHPGLIGFALRELVFAAESCALELAGPFVWRRAIRGLLEGLAVEMVLAEITPAGEPPAKPVAATLSPVGDLRDVLGDDALVLERDGIEYRLVADGTFAVDDSPRWESADGRYAVLQPPDHDSMAWLDRRTGARRDITPTAKDFSRRRFGCFLGDQLVVVDSHLQLGRIRYRPALVSPSGETRVGGVYLNPSDFAVDDASRRMFLVAEHAKRDELFSIALPSLDDARLATLAASPFELFVAGGALFAMFSDATGLRVERYQDRFEVVAAVPGRPWGHYVDGLDLYAFGRLDETTRLYRISLSTGEVVAIGPPAAEVQWSRAGRWLALRHDATTCVDLYERGERRRSVEVGGEVRSFAVSASGGLAAVNPPSTLALHRGDDAHRRIELPTELDVVRYLPRGGVDGGVHF